MTQQVEYLKLAGLEPVVLDIKPFSLLHSLKGSLLGEHLNKTTLSGTSFTPSGEIGVILEIAASNTTITLAKGERVLMNRNIGVSGDDFTAAIQRTFGLDFDTAEEVKLDYGTATIPTEDEEELLNFDAKREQYSPSRVYEALRPVLVELTTEIRRSLEFFRVQAGDANINRVYVTGGGAKLRGLPEAIGDALGFRVELGDPWLTVTVDPNRFDTQYLMRAGPEFAVPLGLALRGVPLISINLLPKHLRRVREPGYWRIIAVLFPLLVLGTLGVIQFLQIQTENGKKREIAELEVRRDELQQYVDKQAQVQAQLAEVQSLIAIRDQVQQGRILWSNELTAMLKTLPAQGDAPRPRIEMQTISMQAAETSSDPSKYEGQAISAEMQVSGKVLDTKALAEFIRALENSEDFGVQLQSFSREEDSGTYSYSLTIGALAGENNVEESESQ